MSAHEEGIIREAAEATRLARMFGCAIEIHISRFGHKTSVVISPNPLVKPVVEIDGETAE